MEERLLAVGRGTCISAEELTNQRRYPHKMALTIRRCVPFYTVLLVW